MRDFKEISRIHSAKELIDFMMEDPDDRVIACGNDLSNDEWDRDGYAKRTDINVYVVMSQRALGSTSVMGMLESIKGRMPDEQGVCMGEIAVIGHAENRNYGGRTIPECIRKLFYEAENEVPGHLLKWTDYEGALVIS